MSQMDWEQQFQSWENALQKKDSRLLDSLESQTRTFLQNRKLADLDWFLAAFAGSTEEDEHRRHFIRIALRRGNQMPARLFAPMLRAAVYEYDPSFNQLFIFPCLRSFGPRKVNEELLTYLETGTNREKAGAVSAFYWSLARHEDVLDEDIRDLHTTIDHLLLTEFVANEDVDVQRRIMPMLHLDPKLYPQKLQPLISQVIKLAREHPDEYIRHRIEVQLGSHGPCNLLPP